MSLSRSGLAPNFVWCGVCQKAGEALIQQTLRIYSLLGEKFKSGSINMTQYSSAVVLCRGMWLVLAAVGIVKGNGKLALHYLAILMDFIHFIVYGYLIKRIVQFRLLFIECKQRYTNHCICALSRSSSR